MVGVSERTNTDGLLGTRQRELVLRVCGGPRDGHIVRLTSTKCAVGAAENCTLRLRGVGVQPLHCLILRGAQRTVIRSWSRDTRLNGRAFDDALLVAGDRLSVGPLEFDVIETGSEVSASDSVEPLAIAVDASPGPATQDAALAARMEENRVEIARLRAELAAEQSDFETRMREQLDAFETQRAAWEENSRQLRSQGEAEFHARLADLDSRETGLCLREAKLSRQLDDARQNQLQLENERQQLDDLRRQIESRSAEITSVRSDLDRQTEELASRQQLVHDHQQRLEQERADLQVRREELDGQRNAHETQHAELEQQRAQLAAARAAIAAEREDLARQKGEFEALRTEVDAARSHFDAERQLLDTQRAELDRRTVELEQHRREIAEQTQREQRDAGEAEQLRTHYEAEQSRLANELATCAERLSQAEQLATNLRAAQDAAENRFVAATRQIADLEQQLSTHSELLKQQREQLAGYEQEAEVQARRCRELGQQIDERDQRLAAAAAEQQSLREALAAAQGSSGSDQQAGLETLRSSLEEAAKKIEFDQAALEMARQQWHEERTAEQAQLRDGQEHCRAIELRLREERETLADLRRELEEERKAIELLREALKPEEPTPAAEPQLSVAQLLRDRQADAERVGESNLRSSKEVDFSAPKTEAPISTSDLFQRLGISAANEDEDVADTRQVTGLGGGERSRQISRPELPPVVSAAPQAVPDEHEESIEEYMQKLLLRSRRAGDGAGTSASYAPTPVVEEKPPIVAEPSPAAPGSPDPAEIDRPVRPRPTAPETVKDMSGLREIANLSARGAIATFDRRKRKNAVLVRSSCAVSTLVLSVALLILCPHDPLLYYCGLVGIVFGLLSTGYALMSILQFRMQSQAATGPVAEASKPDDKSESGQVPSTIAVAEPASLE